jgi:hypothetical protein
MNRKAQLEAEVQVLGTLCNRAGAREQHADIVSAFDHYQFLEQEHQIIFESIRSLLVHHRLSTTRLAVHLNNRGFPDVDLEKYCAAGLPSIDGALKLAVRLRSLAQKAGQDVRYDGKGKVEHEI